MTQSRLLREINIFISSPNDVKEEREVAIRTIESFGQRSYIAERYVLKPLAYEHEVPAAIGENPQATVDHYMMQAAQCDLFICILWQRMGTPVLDEKTGKRFESGTEYEFESAYRANQQNKGKPHILLYRSERSISPSNIDFDQARLVENFFNRFKGPNPVYKGLRGTFKTKKAFEDRLLQDMDNIFSKDFLGQEPAPAPPATTGDILIDLTELKANILKQKVDRLSLYVLGLHQTKIQKLLNSALLIPFRWQFNNEQVPRDDDIVDYLLAPISQSTPLASPSKDAQRSLILADPGVGKSTLTYKLFNNSVDLWMQATTKYVPIHIDLRGYIGETTFGSKDWMTSFFKELSGNSTVYWDGITPSSSGQMQLQPFIILDSLDEFLAGKTPEEITQRLTSLIFRSANVVTCRKQYYEHYLSMSQFSTYFDNIYLLSWEAPNRKEYVQNYFRFYFPGENNTVMKKAAVANQKIDRSPQLQDLCQVPLRLNMILELLSSTSIDPAAIEDLLALYTFYIDKWLKREVDKPGNFLELDKKYSLLKAAAWNFYEERRLGENISIPFTRTELRRFLSTRDDKQISDDIDATLVDLLERTVLVEQTAQIGEIEPSIRFVHKSVQEYFVARYLSDQMSFDAKSTANAFRHMLSPLVWEFVAEYIKRINPNPRLLDQIVDNCISAFKLNQVDGDDKARARIARQQLGYYLGFMKSTKAFEFLKSQLDCEKDLWTKRGIIIGLSLGGHKEYLDQYVDRLRKAREENGDLAENEVNIGFHLSFFGDQTFDELNLDKDQRLATCENTIKALIYQLGTEIDRGAWRLDLFTLLEIEKFRDVSRDNCAQVLKAHVGDLERIVDTLKHDPNCSRWPETLEAEALIKRIKQTSTEKNDMQSCE